MSLIHLLNTCAYLSAGRCLQVYHDPVSEEERLENIRSFLGACQELQLKDDEVWC